MCVIYFQSFEDPKKKIFPKCGGKWYNAIENETLWTSKLPMLEPTNQMNNIERKSIIVSDSSSIYSTLNCDRFHCIWCNGTKWRFSSLQFHEIYRSFILPLHEGFKSSEDRAREGNKEPYSISTHQCHDFAMFSLYTIKTIQINKTSAAFQCASILRLVYCEAPLGRYVMILFSLLKNFH